MTVRLREHLEIVGEAMFFRQGFGCVSRRQEYFEVWSDAAGFDSKLRAIHASGHDDVGEEKIDRHVTFQNLQRVAIDAAMRVAAIERSACNHRSSMTFRTLDVGNPVPSRELPL